MESVGRIKTKKTIFWCEELLVGDIQGLPAGVQRKDVDFVILSPAGVSRTCDTVEDDGSISIKTKPQEMGINTASFTNKAMKHLSGSPFRFVIEAFEDGHLHVAVTGGLLGGGSVGRPGELSISTVQAGPGALSVSTEGPRASRIDFHEESVSVCKAVLMFSTPGDYKISVKFNRRHVPNSPFKILVT